jgi:hypothetical protein
VLLRESIELSTAPTLWSIDKKLDLLAFWVIAIITSSKIFYARFIRSTCPLVIGSKDPGYIAIFFMLPLSLSDNSEHCLIFSVFWFYNHTQGDFLGV